MRSAGCAKSERCFNESWQIFRCSTAAVLKSEAVLMFEYCSMFDFKAPPEAQILELHFWFYE